MHAARVNSCQYQLMYDKYYSKVSACTCIARAAWCNALIYEIVCDPYVLRNSDVTEEHYVFPSFIKTWVSPCCELL